MKAPTYQGLWKKEGRKTSKKAGCKSLLPSFASFFLNNSTSKHRNKTALSLRYEHIIKCVIFTAVTCLTSLKTKLHTSLQDKTLFLCLIWLGESTPSRSSSTISQIKSQLSNSRNVVVLLALQGNNENKNTPRHYWVLWHFPPNSACPLRFGSLGWTGKKEALFRKQGIIRSNLSPAGVEKLVSSFSQVRRGERWKEGGDL